LAADAQKKEGMMQGTDLAWFRRLRAAMPLDLTAAGGITI